MNRGKSPAWAQWGDEMRKKVAIRRGSKTWPRSVEDSEAWSKALELEDGVSRLRPELQDGLVRLLGERKTGAVSSVASNGGGALDAVLAARRGAQAEVAPGERVVERDDKPENDPPEPSGPDHDPTAGEVPADQEPPLRQPGEDG
jgi:hypothetical protein